MVFLFKDFVKFSRCEILYNENGMIILLIHKVFIVVLYTKKWIVLFISRRGIKTNGFG